MSDKIIVIGAGPAGLMASGVAAKRGKKVILLEKNDKIAKKLAITGKGRCNLTNTDNLDDLIKNIPGNGKFLYSSFSKFSNMDLIDFFNNEGLETKVERGGRVFPVSDSAFDVVDVLKKFIKNTGVQLKLNSTVSEVIADSGVVKGVRLKDGTNLNCETVIIATGGLSYPLTGSTGDGYKMASKLGHKITELKPSLTGLDTLETWTRSLSGLTLKNVSVTMTDSKGKTIFSELGEMLFTHTGVSGPLILSASRYAAKYDYKNIKMFIDLKPALNSEKLDLRILRDFEKNLRKQFKNSLDELLPQKLINVIIELSKIDPQKPVNQVTKAERCNLVNIIKKLELNIKGAKPISEAIITSGGIDTLEIKSSTMESKLIKGLFFAGEIIDVDGFTGGYNLTIAFSTGYLAGMNS